MTTSPVAHQLPGGSGGDISRTKPTVKRERGLLALKVDVKMWRIMISEKYIRIMIPKNVEMIGMRAF